MVTVKEIKEALQNIDDDREVYIHSHYDRCGDLVSETLVVDVVCVDGKMIHDKVEVATWRN